MTTSVQGCKSWKCPHCGGVLTVPFYPPVHTPQGPVYIPVSGECEYCGTPLSDEWNEYTNDGE